MQPSPPSKYREVPVIPIRPTYSTHQLPLSVYRYSDLKANICSYLGFHKVRQLYKWVGNKFQSPRCCLRGGLWIRSKTKMWASPGKSNDYLHNLVYFLFERSRLFTAQNILQITTNLHDTELKRVLYISLKYYTFGFNKQWSMFGSQQQMDRSDKHENLPVIRLNCLGLRMAGQRSLRNMKPLKKKQ